MFQLGDIEDLKAVPYPIAIFSVWDGYKEHSLTVAWATQISRTPLKFMVCVGKSRYTCTKLEDSITATLSYITRPHTAIHFGRQSGRDSDKWSTYKGQAKLGDCRVPATAALVLLGFRGKMHDLGSHIGVELEVADIYTNKEAGKILTYDKI